MKYFPWFFLTIPKKIKIQHLPLYSTLVVARPSYHCAFV